jgi:hypothetical protein
VELADARIGCLWLFSPDNPTGRYSLLLSHPAQRLVAVRLLELFCQQVRVGHLAFASLCSGSASRRRIDTRVHVERQLCNLRTHQAQTCCVPAHIPCCCRSCTHTHTQHVQGLCCFPHSVCFTSATLDDAPLPLLHDPLAIRLPNTGIFKVGSARVWRVCAACAWVWLGLWFCCLCMGMAWAVVLPSVHGYGLGCSSAVCAWVWLGL